ncbi:MAG: HD domain-containing protein [Lysobacter sp.]
MTPADASQAMALIQRLGAPAHLQRHVELVGEAGEAILALLREQGLALDEDFVRAGIVLHDVGKTLHPAEMHGPGSRHEPDGQSMLLAAGVSPELARVCLSHAQWPQMQCTLEELLIALSDKLWKGVRRADLEQRVIDEVAAMTGGDRWNVFIALDSGFERVAEDGSERLARSVV